MESSGKELKCNIYNLFLLVKVGFKLRKFHYPIDIILIDPDPMSHFYLYPLLLSQGYQPFQIQQILHSYGIFANHHIQTPSFPSLLSLEQNLFSRPSYSRNLILQQDIQPFSLYTHSIENKNQSFTHNPSYQSNDCIKEENVDSQDKTPESLCIQKDDQRPLSGSKNKKKKKISKMSLKEKRQKQLKRNQTQNSKRNVIPNQIHQMLSILFKKKKSSLLVQKLIQKYSIIYKTDGLSVQRFYLYHSLLKQKINHYANEQSLKILLEPLQPSFKIYSRQEQSLYGKIGLTLIKYFLNNQATLVILNSKRIKSENKLQHLKTKRYLAHVLNEIISEKKYGKNI